MSVRSFEGYRVAAVAALAFAATAPGQTLIISQFNVHLRRDLALGETQLAGAYMVATVLAALPLVYVGAFTDRVGPRRALAVVATLFGVACALFGGLTQGLVTVSVGFFLLRFLGQGSLSLVSAHAVALWFYRRLGVVTGVKSVVVFAAWAVVPPGVLALIEAAGWRWTYALMGLGVAALVVPASLLFVRDGPERVGQHVDGLEPSRASGVLEAEPAFTLREALRTATYWTLAGATLLTPLVATAVLFTLQPLALAAGLDIEVAAWGAGLWSWTMALAALPSGWLVDRVRPAHVLPPGLLLLAGATVLFSVADTRLLFLGAMVGFGVSQSVITASATTALARYFGRAHHGAIRASVSRLAVIATGLGPIVLSASNEWFGSYDAGLWLLAAACVPAGLLAVTLPRRVVGGRGNAPSARVKYE
jgi:MFS transporter, OFA family, oxalate/formate antiporter